MGISVDCNHCGGRFDVKDKRAGKKVYCKLCHGVLRVPKDIHDTQKFVENVEEDIYFESLDEPMPHPQSKLTPLPQLKPTPLRRAKQTRRKTSATWSWKLSPALIFGVIVMCLVGGVLLTSQFNPAVGRMTLAALMIMLMVGVGFAIMAGYIMMLVGGIGLIIAAFEEDVACGLMYIFIPFYSLYYLITRWDETRWPKMVGLGFLLSVGLTFTIAGAAQVLKRMDHVISFNFDPGPQELVLKPPHGEPPLVQNFPAPNDAPNLLEVGKNAPAPNAAAERHRRAVEEQLNQIQRPENFGEVAKPSISENEALRISVPIANASLSAGDKVLIKWGASWWHGTVIGTNPDGSIRVHYDGWSKHSDESVTPSRVRIPTS